MNKLLIGLQELKSIRQKKEDEQLAFEMFDLATKISACQEEYRIISGLTSVSLIVEQKGKRPFYCLQLKNIDLFSIFNVLWGFEPDPCGNHHEIQFV